ncbi:hypothetical protein BDN67DRAFT_278874 [Paxillus ammoniavirescens]|nr:hypothetical protein BDN67DRAFT_278874 [Paxillus ammoniavirescens]
MVDSFSVVSHSSDESDEPQTPPRSPSRLDFCTQEIEDSDTPSESDYEAVMRLEKTACKIDWARSLFRGNRTRNNKFIEEDDDDTSSSHTNLSFLPTLRHGKNCTLEDSDSSSDDDLSTRQTFLPAPPERSPCHAGIEPRAPSPVRPLSVLPQADTEEPTHPSRVSAQRFNYPHHGFSRSALLHQKSFWNSRHDEWMEWQSRAERDEARKRSLETNNAYTGITTVESRVIGGPPPHIRISPSGLERDLQEYPPRKYELDVHAPIYPRVGDISALRDPYSVNVDRCFFKFPLWTIHKTLYVFDMQQRSTFLEPSPDRANGENIRESSPSSMVSASPDTSVSSGDEDSDDTLVADDETSRKGDTRPESPSYYPSPCSSSPFGWNGIRAWELSWYARWELLICLVQRDQANGRMFDACASSEAPVEIQLPPPPAPPRPIFRFAGEDGDEGSEEEEEDDDYGTLVPHPVFSGDSEDGYERAVAFCESRRAEEAL